MVYGFQMQSLQITLFGIIVFAKFALGMTGWWTWSPDALTPHLAFQDAGSGDILHSACNSNGTAIFPVDKPFIFPINYEAKPATALAVSGWWDDDLRTNIASVFYQGSDGSLINAFFHCNFTTGAYETTDEGEWKLSDAIGRFSVYDKTGLSVAELGDAGGFRVFYHDEEEQVNLLAYDDDTDWLYLGPVARKPAAGRSISSVQTNGTNVSVVFPYNDVNVAVAEFQATYKDKWILSSFPTPFSSPFPTNRTDPSDITFAASEPPFSLPAYDKVNVQLRLAASDNATLSMFYIGKDRKLHQSTQTDGQWAVVRGEWPEAEEEFAPLALVTPLESNEIWIYYRNIEGDLLELHQQDGIWLQPTKLLTKNETLVDGDSDFENPDNGGNSSGGNDSITRGDVGGDLSLGAKAGLGIGIGVGVSVLLLTVAILFRRRRSARALKAEDQAQGSDGPREETHACHTQSQYSAEGYSIVASDRPHELAGAPKYELLGDTEHRGRTEEPAEEEGSRQSVRN